MTAAISGHTRAFAVLYERYYPLVNAIVLVRLPDDDVRDVVQDVFAIALRRLDTLRDRNAFGPWVSAIARRIATRKRRRRRPALPFEEDRVPVAAPPPEAFAVLDAVRQLPAAYAETLALRLVAGMTGPEIAQRTGMTHGSVRVNLSRGLKALRAALGGDDDA